MSNEMRARMGLDTAGVSAALSRVGKQAKGAVDTLGGAVPILGQMTTRVGIIAMGIGSLIGITRSWVAEIEKGNRALETGVRTARGVAGRAGLAGMASSVQGVVDSTASQGALNQQELFASASTFMDFAPAANIGQLSQAVRGAQKAGTATNAQGAKNVMAIAGVLVDNGVDVPAALDMAMMLSTGLGNDAARAPDTLQRLMQSMSAGDAVQALLALRGRGRGVIGRALSALEALPQGVSQGVIGGALARAGTPVDFSRPTQTSGFLDQFLASVLDDPNQMLDVQIAAQRNATEVRQQVTANRQFELRRAELETDDVGRIGANFEIPLIGLKPWQVARSAAAGLGMRGPSEDRAAQTMVDTINRTMTRMRQLGNAED